jgi:acetate kinase
MADTILVLNPGSSSIKYSLFADAAQGPEFRLGGQTESLYTSPRVSSASSRVHAWAILTNEEPMIARHTRRLLGAGISV